MDVQMDVYVTILTTVLIRWSLFLYKPSSLSPTSHCRLYDSWVEDRNEVLTTCLLRARSSAHSHSAPCCNRNTMAAAETQTNHSHLKNEGVYIHADWSKQSLCERCWVSTLSAVLIYPHWEFRNQFMQFYKTGSCIVNICQACRAI